MVPALSTEEKQAIAGRARTLHERIEMSSASGKPVDNPNAWMDEWEERVVDGDKAQFTIRLDQLGLSYGDCRERLQNHGWPAEKSLPEWVHQLDDLIQYVATKPTEITHSDAEQPFEHILSVIVAYATERLDIDIPRYISESAVDGSKDVLYSRLDLFVTHPLFIEFKTFFAQRDESLIFSEDPTPTGDPHQYYDQFVGAVLADGLKSFFIEYAFLARLITTFINQWFTTIEEFCNRLESDYLQLEAITSKDEQLGTLIDIEPKGDWHEGGRQVLCLTFEDGRKIAYKPRNLDLEAGLFELLSWINKSGEMINFESIAVIPRDEYGWVEWIDPAPCSVEEEVKQYYHRAGALTCLLYLLGFSDGHLENIIAANEHPVVIDAETLAQPQPDPSHLPVNRTLRRVMHESVLRTGLVPMHWPDSDSTDNSGFGRSTMHSEVQNREFRDINTDLMELSYQSEATLEGDNLPTLDGQKVKGDDYVSDIIQGFEGMYDFLQTHKETLLAEETLTHFRDAEVRYVFRPTDNYARILTMMTTPQYLRTGLKFGCKVESLARPLLSGTESTSVWKLYTAERVALRNGTFPRLSTTTDSTELRVGTTIIEEFFEKTSLSRLNYSINRLSDTDQQEQQRYLRWAHGGSLHSNHRSTTMSSTLHDPHTIVNENAATCARDIGERILSNANYTHTGELTWIRRTLGPNGGVHLHTIPPGLYAGWMGLALFMAALYRVTEEKKYGAAIEEIVDPIADPKTGGFQPSEQSVGGGTGLGGIVYGFTKLGTFLADDRYSEIATRYQSMLTPDRIISDDAFDVVDGSAGAILGLLALYEATGHSQSLERAEIAGDHLLKHSTEIDGIPVWIPSTIEQPLTGFAHGTSGIAYSLTRLSTATQADRFRETALNSLAYERHQYVAREQNWRDLRPDSSSYMDAWCHGRSGIGLARLGIAEHGDLEQVQDELNQALDGVTMALADDDHLCCGTSSRISFLLQAAQVLDEPKYREQATQLLAASIEQSATRGRFRTKWQTQHWYDPAFFQGEAGIGYILLRWLDPTLPSIALFE